MQLDWVEELKGSFCFGENVIFLLHGNVNDLFPFMTRKETVRVLFSHGVFVFYAQKHQGSHRRFQP